MSTTYGEVVRAGWPGASEREVEEVLWCRTAFPFGDLSARSLYKAASGSYRADKNGITICDFCHDRAVKDGLCERCYRALRGGRNV